MNFYKVNYILMSKFIFFFEFFNFFIIIMVILLCLSRLPEHLFMKSIFKLSAPFYRFDEEEGERTGIISMQFYPKLLQRAKMDYIIHGQIHDFWGIF